MDWVASVLTGGGFAAVAAGGVGGLWKYFTSGRRQGQIDQIGDLQESSWTEVKNLREVLDRERAERKQDQTDLARRLDRIERILLSDVAPIVDWLSDGAPVPPPPPHPSQQLRDLIATIRYSRSGEVVS